MWGAGSGGWLSCPGIPLDELMDSDRSYSFVAGRAQAAGATANACCRYHCRKHAYSLPDNLTSTPHYAPRLEVRARRMRLIWSDPSGAPAHQSRETRNAHRGCSFEQTIRLRTCSCARTTARNPSIRARIRIHVWGSRGSRRLRPLLAFHFRKDDGIASSRWARFPPHR